MSTLLPYDYARCHGVGNKECNTCLRKLAPGNPHRQSYLAFTEGQKPQDGTCTSRIPSD